MLLIVCGIMWVCIGEATLRYTAPTLIALGDKAKASSARRTGIAFCVVGAVIMAAGIGQLAR
jgi:hypothetical protein